MSSACEKLDDNVVLITQTMMHTDNINQHDHTDNINQHDHVNEGQHNHVNEASALLENKPGNIIYIGKSTEGKQLVDSFKKLKTSKHFLSNFDLLQWLIQVGELALKEIEKRNDELLNKEQSVEENDDNSNKSCGYNDLQHVGNSVSISSMTSFDGKYLFIPFQSKMLRKNQTPSLFVMKKIYGDHELDDASPSNLCNTSNENRLSELTKPYIMHSDEHIYNKYSKFIQQDCKKVKLPQKTNINKQKKRKVDSQSETDINETDFHRIEQQTQLNDHFTLKNGVVAALQKLPRLPVTHNPFTIQSPPAKPEPPPPPKKSVYIISNNESGVVISAYRENNQQVLAASCNVVEEKETESLIKIIKK